MTDSFNASTEARLSEIEESLSDIWRLLRSVMNREQFNRLNIIRQTEMTKLSTRLDDAETTLTDLHQKYNDLL